MSKTNSNLVITHALELFRVNGYHNTSMSDIGAACGLLKGSIYHYFPSKEALAIEVMQRVWDDFSQHIFSLAYNESKSASERLADFTEAVERYFTGRQGGCLMGNLALEVIDVLPKFAEKIIRPYFNDWTQALVYMLTPRYGDARAVQLAEDAIAKTQGAIMMMRIYNNVEIFRRITQEIVALLN